MAARPVEGPHESSRLVREAVTGVSNTVSCADPDPAWGRTEQEQENMSTPQQSG